MYKRSLFERIEYKYGKYAVRNLMTVIVGVMAFIYLLDYIFVARIGTTLSSYLFFDREAVFSGEVWRIITFALIPPSSNILFIMFSLYLFWLIGSSLEEEWGAFRFNIFYLCGMLGTIIGALIVGSSTNYFLNMSLFLAFALIYPDFEIMLFFVIPIKVKYIAFAIFILFAYSFIVYPWSMKVAILVSLLNLLLFFWRDIVSRIRRMKQNYEMKRRFRR